jgi:hypothetical protein
MNVQKFLSVFLLLLLAGLGSAWAHGVRVGVGVYVGPYWGPGPWYYPPPYYYRPEVIVVPAPQPPAYIEQQPEAPAETAPPQPASQYWYYCAAAKGYYPYVKECPGGWQKVLPQPAK